jgi:hypothetical protein
MRTARNHGLRLWKKIFYCGLLMWGVSVFAQNQSTTKLSQDAINKRIDEIMEAALNRGAVTFPDGNVAVPMKALMTGEESKEIRNFGERAIAPLSTYLDSSSRRAQLLATGIFGEIGGKMALKPLLYAVESCTSSSARSTALASLALQDWNDVAAVIGRVEAFDADDSIRKQAREIIARHQAN